MQNNEFAKLLQEKFRPHIGHQFTISGYANDDIVLECVDCQEALLTVSDFEGGESNCECPLGGDESNNCADCACSGDYYCVNGECVLRES